MKAFIIFITVLLLLNSCELPLQSSEEKQTDETAIIEKPGTLEPYEVIYSYDKYSIPFSTAYLGSGYQKATNLFRNEAIQIVSIRRNETSKFGCSFNPSIVDSYSDAISKLNYFNDYNDDVLYLGEKTRNYLSQIDYNDNNITCIYGNYGLGYYDYVSEYSMLDEATEYYQSNGVLKYYEKYGDMFCSLINTGFACIIIETYNIDGSMDEVEKQEIKSAIRKLYNGITSDDEKNKTMAKIEKPGVIKLVHFFTTLNDDPDKPITNYEELYNYIISHAENGSIKDDVYSIVKFNMEFYSF